ncbi:centrosomal protein of 55 kDa [Latimeria chalumnae]|uniref:Centrosomal protein of 55 kDa n=1 Tax=Latimeria chalumnae TaxID=7897 RepID=M3XI06_LATCH|nr:PREDICTED: centrosomal protein of 55 kDa isoform X1 [Latimeria chalumnae]XP_014341349.1 PREDICTED: centrosomal protein of 55 kDa isoform X1 [Latimeria chalumnae]XP_014341350.1 PREDICTED: centrosomal protein of 55 kDa isoform X1 [Latimeria chalumnae]|eukprot:XP_005991619.1 PREDICTED: centrosomal protein of 55 kDa isoform X1 [Latimeria chalumnae]
MTSKNSKGIMSSRLGLNPGNSRSDSHLEKLKKENALLKKTVEDMTKGKGKLTDVEKQRLLEKILALETLKEKHIQQLAEKDKAIQCLKEQCKSKGHEDIAALHNQLAEKNREAQIREHLFKSLSEEAETLKAKLSAVTLKCQEVGSQASALRCSQDCVMVQAAETDEIRAVQEQLNDALAKNQQWLVYDQQREAYVRGLLARIFELEQQLSQIGEKQHKERSSQGELPDEKQKYYDRLLVTAKKELEAQKESVKRLSSEVSELRAQYEGKNNEVKELRTQLQAERGENKQKLEEEKRLVKEKAQMLKTELEMVRIRLDEEKRRSSDLSHQVQLLQKSLLIQKEEQKKIDLLEQQIQMCTTDFENEKVDRQNLQHQLHKVLKELRKAREQITRLEAKKHQWQLQHSEPSIHHKFEEKLIIYDDPATSPKRSSLLDESFLECPKCKIQYPTSQHRELLNHIDFCED